MSEASGRLCRAENRLFDAQQGAIDATGRTLGAGAQDLDEQPGAGERLGVALVDVRDILEDPRDVLGGGV